jgi:hypothetical protein
LLRDLEGLVEIFNMMIRAYALNETAIIAAVANTHTASQAA